MSNYSEYTIQQDSSRGEYPSNTPPRTKKKDSELITPSRTGSSKKKANPATQSPLNYDDLQASIAQIGLYDTLATDKNISSLTEVDLKAVKAETDSACHGFANSLLMDSKWNMVVPEINKTCHCKKVIQQILCDFWMDTLHGHASTKALAKSMAASC